MSAVASAQAKLLQQQQCSRVFALLDRSASGEALRECKRLLGGGPTQPAGAPAGAGAAPGETVELTAPRAAQAFPLAEALLAFAYMQAKQHVLALSTALRLKQEGWGSGDHQVAVPLASVLRHYHKCTSVRLAAMPDDTEAYPDHQLGRPRRSTNALSIRTRATRLSAPRSSMPFWLPAISSGLRSSHLSCIAYLDRPRIPLGPKKHCHRQDQRSPEVRFVRARLAARARSQTSTSGGV